VTLPLARSPIRGVLRYGRAVNKAALDLIHRKHMAAQAGRLQAAQAGLAALQAHVAPVVPNTVVTPVGGGAAASGAPGARRGGAQSLEALLAERTGAAIDRLRAAAAGRGRVAPPEPAASAVLPALRAVLERVGLLSRDLHAVMDAYSS
jgi:hypothetical protein